MTAEEWRDAVGFPGYRVSNLGRIFSDKSQQILTPWNSGPGYPSVSLRRKDGARKKATVHSLVAEAFHGPRPEGMEIRHLDGSKDNCAASNLQYGTRSENQLDRVIHGTHNHASKTHCKNGHEFTESNTYRSPSNPRARDCRTCTRTRAGYGDARSAVAS